MSEPTNYPKNCLHLDMSTVPAGETLQAVGHRLMAWREANNFPQGATTNDPADQKHIHIRYEDLP